MSGHTPGAWVVGEGVPQEGNIYGGGFIVASIGDNFPNAQANRRLIAAAPRLESIVQKLLADADRLSYASDAWRVPEELLLAAREVIDDIEGRE